MRIVILGAGISGLALAWALQRRYGSEIALTLVEASPRVGGWIRTFDQEGFLFDIGPRACRPDGAEATLNLIEELGLQSSLIHASPAAKQRYLYTKGKLEPLPTSLFRFLTSPLTRPMLWRLFNEWRVGRGAEEESIHAFISRRLGAHTADLLFDPLTLGIHAGDSRVLSMKACFPKLVEWERSAGSLTRGFLRSRRQPASKNGCLFSLVGGMQELVDALGAQLAADIRLGMRALAIQGNRVLLSTGESLLADRIYTALPASAAADVLAEAAPQSSRLLKTIPANTVTVVNLGYRSPQLALEGFGYLIPSCERESILGVVWDSSVFPQQNRWRGQTRLTVMIAGAKSDAKDVACEAVERHLGIRRRADVSVITVAPHAIPQYTLGHLDRIETLRRILQQEAPQVELLGNSFYGLSVNDCIAKSRRLTIKSNF